ncbi:MAG: nuclear transport factor 2 family protein [Flavobacteriales bacterium]|nr:nuclear transport factor 2 family protein [Flavobacteriales bacterium]
MSVVHRFYTALREHDWRVMNTCYHADARFHDPVFGDLDVHGVRAMWELLLARGTDLQLSYQVEHEDGQGAVVAWEARYTFTRTGRKVVNKARTVMTVRDGLIAEQEDAFDRWRWARQALGLPGLLLGWSPAFWKKVRTQLRLALGRQGEFTYGVP